MLMTVSYEADGEEVSLWVPSRFEVCEECEGRGKVDHPAFSNGFTMEELDEDPDFREDYFRGHYDVVCPGCRGERVVMVPDVSQCSYNQKRHLVEARRVERAEADYWRLARAEEEAERRFGC